MGSDSPSLLMFQEYETPEGMRYMVWMVPSEEFTKMANDYAACCNTLNEARRWALSHFVMQNRAKLVCVTDQDAELFAANLREEGWSARFQRD